MAQLSLNVFSKSLSSPFLSFQRIRGSERLCTTQIRSLTHSLKINTTTHDTHFKQLQRVLILTTDTSSDDFKTPATHITRQFCSQLMTYLLFQVNSLYLSELISHYLPPRSLRSSNTNLLTRPAGITSNLSSRAFSVSAPSTWNSLLAHIRSIDTLSTFKRHLKFHLFQPAFTV